MTTVKKAAPAKKQGTPKDQAPKETAPKKDAKKDQKPEQPVIEAEVIPEPPASKELTVEQIAANEVVKLDMNKVKIEQWKTEFGTLAIKDFTDKENYKKVKEAKATIRTARTGVEAKRKAIKADYIAIGKKIDGVASEYTDALVEIETPLDDMLAKWEEWETAEKTRKDEEKKAEITRRVNVLKENGMTFDGNFYVVGDTMSMDIASIESMTIADFEALTYKVILEVKKQKEKAEEEEKERKAEQERKDKEAEELQKAQAALQKEKDELLEAQKNMRLQRLNLREQLIVAAGLIFNPGGLNYCFRNDYTNQSVSKEELEQMGDASFNAALEEIKGYVSSAKEKQAAADKEKKDKAERINARTQQVIALGLVFNSGFYGKSNEHAGVVKIAVTTIDETPVDQWQAVFTKLEHDVAIFDKTTEDKKDQLAKHEQKMTDQFNQRTSELISAGMTLVGVEFVRASEFGGKVFINRDVVRATDEDTWPGLLGTLQEKVKTLNEQTETKRQQLIREKEAQVPEIDRTRKYFSTMLTTAKPDIKTQAVLDILLGVEEGLTQLITTANNKLLALEADNK